MAEAAGPEILCEGVSKRFAAGGATVEAVAPLSLRLAGGRTSALVGPSGCGKSTLLRMIAGLEAPSSGTLTIGGQSPQELQRAGALAMAFQDPSLLPWRSVRGNVALALKLARQPVGWAAVDDMLERVGLQGFEEARPAALSGGMRQRVAIARCLITKPRLLLLDEPFGAVDELTRARLNEDLPPLWRASGTTVVIVTHSVREAVALADRVVVFSSRPARVVADLAVPPGLSRSGSEDLRAKVSAALAKGWDRAGKAAE